MDARRRSEYEHLITDLARERFDLLAQKQAISVPPVVAIPAPPAPVERPASAQSPA